LVNGDGHRRADNRSIRPPAVTQCGDDLRPGPAADADLFVGLIFGPTTRPMSSSNVKPPDSSMPAATCCVALRGEWQLPQAPIVVTR
jgi:hypothetical protein